MKVYHITQFENVQTGHVRIDYLCNSTVKRSQTKQDKTRQDKGKREAGHTE